MTTDLKELAERLKLNASLCEEMTVAGRFNQALFGEAADAILVLIRERDEAREQAVVAEAREHNAHLAAKEERAIADAAEAALSAAQEEVGRLKVALADSIRRPMGVIPASAEGLITYADVAAAEEAALTRIKEAT